jgi:hypothetical protein
MIRFVLTIALAGAAAGCVTTRATHPLPREPGNPVVIKVLGAEYTVPAHVDVPDHVDVPGKYVLEYVDRVTSCAGFLHLESVGTADAHAKYMRDKIEDIKRNFERDGIKVDLTVETLEVAQGPARKTSFALSKASDRAAAAVVDLHSQEQTLSIVGFSFCADAGLINKTVGMLTGLIASQKVP